jgi:hypothetical protein
LSKIIDSLNTLEKVAQKIWATFVIFRKLSKENNHEMGENSTNLVTLFGTFIPQVFRQQKMEAYPPHPSPKPLCEERYIDPGLPDGIFSNQKSQFG